jgi:excisionase family DNA binding protein
MEKDTYTTKEAAAKLKVSSARVRQMVLDGTLPAEKFGRDLVITREAIEAAKHRKTSPGPAAKTKQATARVTKKRSKKRTSAE